MGSFCGSIIIETDNQDQIMKQLFNQSTFKFLKILSENNNREWFHEHKADYEMQVRTPALTFIEVMQGELPVISAHFIASPKKVGGSLMRVYRDTRFSKDKTPYKTNVGIQFRHERGKDVHAPGFYLHIADDECFLGVGVWHPDSQGLGKIRDAIVNHTSDWQKAMKAEIFNTGFSLTGESLKRNPKGFSIDHPLITDLKRKDFIAIKPISKKMVLSDSLVDDVVKNYTDAMPFMRFLCKALELNV